MADKTKYVFDGSTYSKGRLVLEVIRTHVKNTPDITFAQLQSVFPKKVQGSLGCFHLIDDAIKILEETGHKRHFLASSDIIEIKSGSIAVSSQWGVGNIEKFINQASSLGYVIEENSGFQEDDVVSDESNRPFEDMPLTELLWHCFGRAEIQPGVGWSDERDISQFKVELEVGETAITIFADVHETTKNIVFCGYYTNRIKIGKKQKIYAEAAINKVNSLLTFGKFNLSDESLIRFEINLKEEEFNLDDDLLDTTYMSVWSNMNTFSKFLSMASRNAVDVNEAFSSTVKLEEIFNPSFEEVSSYESTSQDGCENLDCSDEEGNYNSDNKDQGRHLLTVSFRRNESYIFRTAKVAGEFEKSKALDFIFTPSQADDSNETFHIKIFSDLIKLEPAEIQISRSGKVVEIFADYIFQVEVDSNCDCNAFDEWASDNGGWSSAYFEPICDWEVNDEFEGTTYFGTRNQWGFVLDGNEDFGESLTGITAVEIKQDD